MVWWRHVGFYKYLIKKQAWSNFIYNQTFDQKQQHQSRVDCHRPIIRQVHSNVWKVNRIQLRIEPFYDTMIDNDIFDIVSELRLVSTEHIWLANQANMSDKVEHGLTWINNSD